MISNDFVVFPPKYNFDAEYIPMLFSITGNFPANSISHQGSASIKKFINKRESSIKNCIPPKIVFYQKSSSI